MFWQNALANFIGSIAAAAFLWFVITRFYELPRSRKQTKELLSVSYALVRFELVFNELYCRELMDAESGRVPAGFPVTQGWETLHSTEAFRHLPPLITGRLILIYSLIFRLRANVEFLHSVLLEEGRLTARPNAYSTLGAEVYGFTKQVAEKVLTNQKVFNDVLDSEINKLSAEEKRVFHQAYLLYEAEARIKASKSSAK